MRGVVSQSDSIMKVTLLGPIFEPVWNEKERGDEKVKSYTR